MFQRIRNAIMVLALASGALSAHIHPCPGKIGVEVQYLYLRPSVDDTYFVNVDFANHLLPEGERTNNDFHFRSGFRVGGVYALCNCNQELQLFYTRLKTDTSKTVTGDFLSATINTTSFASNFNRYTGSASSKLDLLYQRVDGLFAFKAYNCCNINFYLKAGLEYPYVRLHENYLYDIFETGFFGEILLKSRMWGIGPEFGFELDYALWTNSCGWLPGTLSLTAATSASILSSKTKSFAFDSFTANFTVLNIDDEPTWRLIPAWHANLGVIYDFCVGCYAGSIEVGYEFNNYFNAITRSIYTDDVADDLVTTEYFNFGAQGLYVSFGVAF